MQNSVPRGEGGMVAVLGSEIKKIEDIINNNSKLYECFIANDNSDGQIVVSGKTNDLDKFILDLKKIVLKILNYQLAHLFIVN